MLPFLRDQSICFVRHTAGVFGGGCGYRHGIVPTAIYIDVSLYVQRAIVPTEKPQIATGTSIRTMNPARQSFLDTGTSEAALDVMTCLTEGTPMEEGDIGGSEKVALAFPSSTVADYYVDADVELAAVHAILSFF